MRKLPAYSFTILLVFNFVILQLMFQKHLCPYWPNQHYRLSSTLLVRILTITFPITQVIIDGMPHKRIRPKIAHFVPFQMPYLDQWSAVAEDYSHSLSGAIDALLNLSLRLPTSGGVKVRYDVTCPSYNTNIRGKSLVICIIFI